MKHKIMLARFPYGHAEHDDVTDYFAELYHEIKSDPRFDVMRWKICDTPITMGRNRALSIAKKNNVDYVLMIDSDMAPDLYSRPYQNEQILPDARPFWKSSIDFALSHNGPCCIGAPYCGPPPEELVYVFHWRNRQSNNPNQDLRLDMIPREHAAMLGGIQEVAALPTGLYLIDMRALEKIKQPYFSYEWDRDGKECEMCGQREPGPQDNKASTEDVVFTRDLSLAGVPQYCNWDAWAGHNKVKRVGKPIPYTIEGVGAKLREAVIANRREGEKLVCISPPR